MGVFEIFFFEGAVETHFTVDWLDMWLMKMHMDVMWLDLSLTWNETTTKKNKEIN